MESNYRRNLSAVERGFLQGVVTCAVFSAKGREPVVPALYMKALQELGRHNTIIIVPVDKGGGVVIIDDAEYVTKIKVLLWGAYLQASQERKCGDKILHQRDRECPTPTTKRKLQRLSLPP